jgi:hypothetical protein
MTGSSTRRKEEGGRMKDEGGRRKWQEALLSVLPLSPFRVTPLFVAYCIAA